MIEKTMTVYICEHCRKLYQIKRFIEPHEKFCKKNPANKHKCFELCKYLKRTKDYDEWEHGGIEYTVFTCEKTGKEMYSFIAERKGLIDKGYISGERMPLECEGYQNIYEILT
jgi:hypothetical protein